MTILSLRKLRITLPALLLVLNCAPAPKADLPVAPAKASPSTEAFTDASASEIGYLSSPSVTPEAVPKLAYDATEVD